MRLVHRQGPDAGQLPGLASGRPLPAPGLAADLQEASQKRLQMFVLRAKVKLAALTDSSVMLGLSGPQAEEALAESGLPCPAGALTTAASDTTVIHLDGSRYVIVAPNPPWPRCGKS
jgi:hypothetical protein